MANAQQVVSQALGNLAVQLEDNIDKEINRLDHLNDQELNSIKQNRVKELKKRQEKSKEWLARGHGEYINLFEEQEFFKHVKGEERVVCHFYRDNWPCKVMDKHMSELCKKHMETKFMRINAEKSPFLAERLRIWMLPTLALIRDGKVEDYIAGFVELGNTDEFKQEVLEQRLAKGGAIDYEWPVQVPKAYEQKKSITKGGAGFQKSNSDEDSDFD